MTKELAREIVEQLFDDLGDREGIGDVFGALGERIRLRIAGRWMRIIMEAVE